MFTLQTDTGWGALGRTSGAHTQGKKLRRHDVKVGELGCSSMGRRQRALPRGDCRRQGQQALSGRKLPASDRQMSSRITAPAHTVGAVVFSSIQEGLVRVGMDSSRRVNYGQASGTCQCWTSQTSLARTLVWQLRWIRETTGWDQTSLGRFAVAMRDGDRCSDNRSLLGLAGLLDARGSRKAVAVQDGCREISCQTAAQREPQRASRWTGCAKLHAGGARVASRPA